MRRLKYSAIWPVLGAMVTLRRTWAVKRPQRVGASTVTGKVVGEVWPSGDMRGSSTALPDSNDESAVGPEGEERQVVDGGGFAGDAVVVHGVDAVGSDVHLEEGAVRRPVVAAEIVNAFDGDAAEGEVVGELPVGDSEGGQVVAEPLRENVHDGLS